MFNLENYCIRRRLFGQTTKQPLTTLSPENLENISNFKG